LEHGHGLVGVGAGVCVQSPEQHPYEPQPPPGPVPPPLLLPHAEPEPPPGPSLTTLWLAGADLDNVAACAAVPVSTRAAPIANMPEITRIRSFIPAPLIARAPHVRLALASCEQVGSVARNYAMWRLG